MVELLAPAGDFERLKIACLYGADAVYFGGQSFGLRANAKNFSNEDIIKATEYAHSLNKKVYVTVNIVFHNDDLNGLDDYLIFLNNAQVDGIIVSDIVVLNHLKHLKLNLFVVLSTQASTLNYEAVNFWKNLGVKRIVLARESLRDNTKDIIAKTGIETETFIHGAMCTSISGKCVLSNYVTNRDSNRGGCAQICRWCFKVDNAPDFTMTPKDLNMISNIEDMINIGLVSFKVEGRMRSIYYIGTVILAYRKIIDGILNKSLTNKEKEYYLNILNRCANRESKEQFYNSLPSVNDQYFNAREEITNKDFLGIVLAYDENNKLATIEQRNYFEIGTTIQFFGPDIETFDYQVKEIFDEKNETIKLANHPQMIIKLKVSQSLTPCTMMRLKVFDKPKHL